MKDLLKTCFLNIRTAIIVLFSLFFCLVPYCVDVGNSRTIVYTTDYGSSYHLEGCGSLWNSSHAHSLVTISRGNKAPCHRCNPPRPNFAWYWQIGFFVWFITGHAAWFFLSLILAKIRYLFIAKEKVINYEEKQMEKHSLGLYKGQQLWYRNKHTGMIESVSVTSVADNKFEIDYHGKQHELDLQAIGTRLYISPNELSK